jgi:hypothetical protein
MKTTARLYITNLSDENAMELMAALKREPSSRGAKFQLDHPDPPELCEKEYDLVEHANAELEESVDDVDGYGGSDTKGEVFADIKRLRKHQARIEQKLGAFGLAITKLEVAAKKLQ